MIRVEIVSGEAPVRYTEARIAEVLQHARQRAGGDSIFSGRPVTELVTDDCDFIKLRTEYSLPERDARLFIAQASEREKRVGVHAREKCWFLLFDAEGGTPVIGNIMPRRQPLDTLAKPENPGDTEHFPGCLYALVDMYLHVAREHQLALDLSLSNFALEENGSLCYLDDEFYPADELAALPDFLAALLRTLGWLDARTCGLLGGALRERILAYGHDRHALTVLGETLRGSFVAEEMHAARAALVAALQGDEGFSWTPRATAPVMALLADVHANAPALEAVLGYLDERGIDHGLVLGDMVGYGPHPQECIELLRAQTRFSFIRGNHDHAVATGHMVAGATSLAGWTLNWTMERLDPALREWLGELPPYLQQGNWLAVHGAPRDRTFFNAYVYQMTYSDNLDELASRGLQLCFHGHTHIQKIYFRAKGVDGESLEADGVLRRASQALVCPGSIGQPRAGTPGAEFAVLNLETLDMEFHRLDYDLETTVRDMKRAGFPEALGVRLRQGQ